MSRRRRDVDRQAPRPRCVLDAGGLSALCGPSQHARAWLRWIVENGGAVIVPTPILVEATTGDPRRDAEVNRVLDRLERAAAVLRAPDEAAARRAGQLRYRARTDDGIDALVAAVAAVEAGPAVVLTSDPDHLARLLADEPRIAVRRV